MSFVNILNKSKSFRVLILTLFISMTVSAAQAQDAASDKAAFTPLTEAEVESLFQHPRLEGQDASEYTAEEMFGIKAYLDESDAFFAKLTPQRGEVIIAKAGVTLNIPEGFYYLGTKDARTVLEDYWNNPEDDDLLGMIFVDGTNQDFYDYAIEVNFEKTGYVSDEDAANIDYDKLLNDLKKSARDDNPARIRLGFPAITVQGWAADPKYDAQMHRLHWAKLLKFEGDETNTLNYNLRVLGRKGVLQFNFIAEESGLDAVNADLDTVVQIAQFNEDHRYTDFNPKTDQVAAYGVAGLIAGGVAAKKLGLVAILLLFLKKGWWLILAAFAFIGKLFSGRSKEI